MRKLYLLEEYTVQRNGKVGWHPIGGVAGAVFKTLKEANSHMDVAISWNSTVRNGRKTTISYRVTPWQRVERKQRARVYRKRSNGNRQSRVSKRNIGA